MFDGAEATDDVIYFPIRQHHRIPTGDNHVADFGVTADIVQTHLDIVVGDRIRIPHFALSGAESAVDRAHVIDIKQDSIRIAMRDVGNKAIIFFTEWIVFFKTGSNQFFCVRDNLFPDWVSRLLD